MGAIHKEEKSFIKLSIWYLVLNAIYMTVYITIIPLLKEFYYFEIIQVVLHVISAIYLIRSKRVKNTFVR